MNRKTTQTSTRTKDRIFMTAAELFATHGFDRVSIRRICDEVGVGKPTLYYYFKDKETLIEELLDYSTRLGEDLVAEFMNEGQSFPEQFLAILKIHQAYLDRYPYFVRFFTALNVHSMSERIRQKLVRIQQDKLDRTREFFLAGQQSGFIPADMDVDFLVTTFLGTIHQMIFLQIYHSKFFPLSDENLQKFYQFWKNRIFVNIN